jgi:DMSO reductase family type II enzyme heme b subunit
MGLNLMKKLVPLCFFVALVAACNSPEQDAPAREESVQPAPATTIIDNTPVTALAVGGSITAMKTDADMENPENVAWREAQEYSMQLGMAPPVHPSINLRYDATTVPVPVFLRAATDGKNFYLRMRWPDNSEDKTTSREDFADGAAVQFALGDSATTSFMMGAANGPVNIWYWKAGQPQTQNLAAGGFGSTKRLESAGLSSNSVYRDGGEWLVVFSRPLEQSGEYQIALDKDKTHMSFALWQGDQKQRDGLKHVSMGWVEVQLDAAEPPL